MSDILKSILGLVVDKARTATANSLSDGDLTDERMREVIISNIDDIKSSLRGLSRQHLNSSLSFLKEGISRMGLAVRHTSASTQNVKTAITHVAEEFVTGASASTSQQTQPRSADEILSLSNFEIVSQDRWVGAKESFKMSREQATIAFGNTALSIEDRIMASKLRIASSILEKFLDDLEVGAQDCLLYLQEIHDLPAIRKTFTVHRDGGFKSYFKTTKRIEIVKSLTTINGIVFDFIWNFTEIISRSFKWPVIQLTNSEKGEHIFVSANDIRRKLMSKRWPNLKFSVEDECIDLYFPNSVAVSSAGRIYWDKQHGLNLKGEYFGVKVCRDIGRNDDILYVLEYLIDRGTNEGDVHLRLKVDDLKNNSWREFTQGLPPTRDDTVWVMRVLDNKIVLCNGFGEVLVLTYNETQHQLNTEYSFSLPSTDSSRENPRDFRMEPYMCVTDKREVIIARSHGKEVYICPITEEGQMEGMIRVPLQQHETKSKVCGVAFDVTHEEDVVVLRKIPHLESSFQIEVYSRNGDIRNVYPLPGSFPSGTCLLLSNPKGVVAVVQSEEIGWMFNSIKFWYLVGKVFFES